MFCVPQIKKENKKRKSDFYLLMKNATQIA